jgi:hypothetical protein
MHTTDQLLTMASTFEELSSEALIASAKAKDKRKLDPRAGVRTRGKVVFPAESSNVKDKKDHYPINDADQARNAWARAHQTGGKAPSWYKGSYSGFISAIRSKIKSAYPSIELSEKKSK